MQKSILRAEGVVWVTSVASKTEAHRCLVVVFGSFGLCSNLGANKIQR